MIKLNLTAENDCQQAIKDYLENNVSEVLAEKINNGVKIEKDGKTLIKKKTLSLFWEYASMKAQEMKTGYVANDTVFGWAIHYFEEDGFVGKLYNEDGSEYVRPKPTQKPIQHAPAPTIQAKPTPQAPKQFTLFDMLTEEKKEERIIEETSPTVEETIHEPQESVEEERYFDEEDVDRETGEILRFKTREPKRGSSLYQDYLFYKKQYSAHVVAYRVGDFYEFFGEDAIRLANYMNLTLTGRDCGLDERIPMVGIPYHAAEPYFMKIATKYKLAIVDNGEISTMENEETVFINETITEEEKRDLFDDDLNEKEPTVYENNNEEDDFEEERALQKFFDKDALCSLYELFDYTLDMQ